jgi:predicted RNA-binding protein with PIN domain
LPYIIDGHNLIGAMQHVRLDDPDDEMYLIGQLRRFCARTRRRVTVYFDKGAPGMPASHDAGGLSVRFVKRPLSADQAIARHLVRLKGNARNWTVISSDQEVQAAARHAGAHVMSSAEFARTMSTAGEEAAPSEKPGGELSEQDVEEWQEVFRKSRRAK